MTMKSIHAVFEHGVFRPVDPVTGISEGSLARVEIESPGKVGNSWEALAPVFGTVAHEDIVQMETAIAEAFGRVGLDT